MILATVSSKGQITLPAKARRGLGIRRHGRVSVEVRGHEMIIKPAPDLLAWKGFAGKALPLEQEQEALGDAVSGHRLGRER
ncbi:MAG: AbrB/MazE/SpoVT family DNA-binding domain-containing protein [bacterium]